MQDFIKLAWTEICKTGAYLVVNTPSAASNLAEQLKKYSTNVTTDSLSDRVFGDYQGTPGLHAHQLQKLKLLLDAIYAKAPDEDSALKDYAFALRNMLLHSQYKSVIKYLEKPSTTPNSAEDYLAEVAKFNIDSTFDPFTKAKYLLLYSFIKNIIETNRIMARVSLDSSELEADVELNRYFQFISQNNVFSEHLKHQMHQPTSADIVDIGELTHYFQQFHPGQQELSLQEPISAVALLQYLDIYVQFKNSEELLEASHYFKEKYSRFEQTFKTLGLHVHEVLQQASFTPADLYSFMQKPLDNKPAKQKRQLVIHILNAALAQYLGETTARLNTLFQQDTGGKVVVQKTPKTVSEAPLKKELFDTKNVLKQLEVEQAQLKKQLKETLQQNEGLQQRLAATQQKNEAIQQQLKQAKVQEILSPNAKELIREMAFLANELTVELGLKEETSVEEEMVSVEAPAEELSETPTPATPNYIEKVADLKLAVIGGHDKYHHNIKKAFKQDIFTLGPDRLNSDVSKLLNYDVLVFITSYNNHNLYERSYDYVKKHQAKDRCLILNTQPNPKRLAQFIYEFVKERGLTVG